MRWARNAARMGEMRNSYRILAGMPGVERPGSPKLMQENNIKTDFRVGWDGSICVRTWTQ
jgi:hypothetical protein